MSVVISICFLLKDFVNIRIYWTGFQSSIRTEFWA